MTQPVEPTFATTYAGWTENTLGIVKLVTDHQRDFMDIGAADAVTMFTTKYIATSAVYSYDPVLCQFVTPWVSGNEYYRYIVVGYNYYPTSDDVIRDVQAKARPVEIRFPDRKFYDASKVYLRVGIAKQMLQDGTETDASLRTFDGAWNISNGTTVTVAGVETVPEQRLYTYELPEDVNVNVAISRVNGLRSYLLTQLPLATDTDTGCSFEVGMTNEGRLFDYLIIAIPSNME
jgi:hypothetical protein